MYPSRPSPLISRARLRWALLCSTILAVVVLPFCFFGASVDAWTAAWLQSASAGGSTTALILGMLLACDVLLPIPSSLVSTAAGALFGVWSGSCISAVGMTVSSSLGYWLGRSAGRTTAQHLIGTRELVRLERIGSRYGYWLIVAVRAVPVLAESSTFFAGMSRMPLGRFILLSGLTNLGISLVYATLGVYAAHLDSVLLAGAGVLLIPLMTLFCLRQKQRKPRPLSFPKT